VKICALPDVHGSDNWRKASVLLDAFDKMIFLGDYFDAWENKWPSQMNNAKKIIQLKKEYPHKVFLCWGNHDTSYYLNEQCSGYQLEHAADIEEFLGNNKDLLESACVFDNWIFCHAGVSAAWMACAGIRKPEEISMLFKENPNYFRFVGPDMYGDNYNEGPLWIRPESLMPNAVQKYNQCVGHTEQGISPAVMRKGGYQYVLTDTRKHDYITIIDTATDEVIFKKC